MPPRSLLGWVSMAALASCTTAGSTGTTSTSGPTSGAGAGATTGATTGVGGASSVPMTPDPSCAVPDVTSATTTIMVSPSAPTTADVPTITVTDTQKAQTNVGVTLCTPLGPKTPMFGGVDSGTAPYAWHWVGAPLPAGDTQVIFRADPNGTVYRTAHVFVTAAASTSSSSTGGGPPPPGLCENPAGNLIAHGTFEEGFDMLAPHGWQVRNPAQPNGPCLMSGTPSQHVYLSTGAPACGGHALTIDALNQWDCYAVQNYSDYNTIVGGYTYRISAAVRAQGNAVNPAAYFVLGAQWLDGTDTVFGDIKNPKPAMASLNDYDWKVMTIDVVAPANAKRIVVWLSGHYPGRVDYDNVAVTQIAP